MGDTIKVPFIKKGKGEQLIEPRSLIGCLYMSKSPIRLANNSETIKPIMKNGTAIKVRIFNNRSLYKGISDI